MQADALTMQANALGLQANAFGLQTNALTMQTNALGLQSIAKYSFATNYRCSAISKHAIAKCLKPIPAHLMTSLLSFPALCAIDKLGLLSQCLTVFP